MADIREIQANYSGGDVTLVTTAEGIVISAPGIPLQADVQIVCILAWGQLTTGAAVTAVTPRIRRGTLITSTLIGEANAENLKAAAGQTEPFFIMVTDTVIMGDAPVYSFTLQQTGGAANGTVLQASILVMAF